MHTTAAGNLHSLGYVWRHLQFVPWFSFPTSEKSRKSSPHVEMPATVPLMLYSCRHVRRTRASSLDSITRTILCFVLYNSLRYEASPSQELQFEKNFVGTLTYSCSPDCPCSFWWLTELRGDGAPGINRFSLHGYRLPSAEQSLFVTRLALDRTYHSE